MNANTYTSPSTTGGNLDYVSSALTLLEPEERPYTSGIAAHTSQSNATYSEKGMDDLPTVNVAGSPEGTSAGQGGNKAAKRVRYGVYAHRSVETWSVTDVQKTIARKGGVAFTRDEEAYAKTRCLRALNRNIEAVCLSSLADVAPSASGEMRTRGCFNWLGGSAANVPTVFQTPAAQRLTGIATLVENGSQSLRSVLTSLLTSTGEAGDYRMLLGSTYLTHMDLFSSSTSAEYVFKFENMGKMDELRRVVKVYTCSAGTVRSQYSAFLDVTTTTTTGAATAALILKPQHWEIDFLEPVGESEYREDSGGCNGAFKAIFFNHCLHPQGSAFIMGTAQT